MANVFTQNASSISPNSATLSGVIYRITAAERYIDQYGRLYYRVTCSRTASKKITVFLTRFTVSTRYGNSLSSFLKLASDTVQSSADTGASVAKGTTTSSASRQELIPDSIIGDFYDHDITLSLPAETMYAYNNKFTITFDSATATIPRCKIDYIFSKVGSSTTVHPSSDTVTVPNNIECYAGDVVNNPGSATTTDTNYRFDGWYTDTNCTTKAEFPITVSAARSAHYLYAGWKEAGGATVRVKVDGAWEEGELKAKVNGEWVDADAAYVKVNGAWMEIN